MSGICVWLGCGTVAPSAWAGLWHVAERRRGSQNALPQPCQDGCTQGRETEAGMEMRAVSGILNPTPSPASHPHLWHPTHPLHSIHLLHPIHLLHSIHIPCISSPSPPSLSQLYLLLSSHSPCIPACWGPCIPTWEWREKSTSEKLRVFSEHIIISLPAPGSVQSSGAPQY